MRTSLDRHYAVIDQQDWARADKRHLRAEIRKVLERDGEVDVRALTPQYRWNLCVERLKDGLFEDWTGFEYRSDWAVTFLGINGFQMNIPKWDGSPVKHLVVLGEQGVGDEILFLSALPELIVRLGHDAIEVQCYPSLKTIVERSFHVRVTERKTLGRVVEGEAAVALGDLFPFYRRDVRHFPRKPYLKPDPEKVEYWKNWLKSFGEGPKIGVAWRSRHGSLELDDLLTQEGHFFDLQYDSSGSKAHSVPFNTKTDLENLFAFVKALDSVHTVTQTLVHVAGSVGTPCYAIIPPNNGEVTVALWYHACKSLGQGKTWPHLIYPSVKLYEDVNEFRRHRRPG
jgi:hypothetical protein